MQWVSEARRFVWLICAVVYLWVFVGGIRAGGDDLLTLARAIGFTLAAGVLGHKAVGILSRASLPSEPGPSADESGPVGSLAELIGSANVGQHEDRAEAA